MAGDLSVVAFPDCHVSDIPRMLRALADRIEAGNCGDVHNLAWVLDKGDGQLEIGLMGQSGEAGPVAHFLFALAMRKVESVQVL